jgi:HAD superfamily hydrolase (TIGR01509 family)
MLKAVVFDLDGTVLDTERAVVETWREVYTEHGATFPRERFLAAIGTHDPTWDPYAPLTAGLSEAATRALRRRKEALEAHLVAQVPARPGIQEWLDWCRRHDVAIGCASSSPLAWVEQHLTRLGIAHHFDCVRAREHVTAVKPDPQLYELTVRCLGGPAEQALAIEDSLPGALAAKRAGLACVVYPNDFTPPPALDVADAVVDPVRVDPGAAFTTATRPVREGRRGNA